MLTVKLHLQNTITEKIFHDTEDNHKYFLKNILLIVVQAEVILEML